MFGDAILVAPVLHAGEKQRDVYLPVGSDWINVYTNDMISGGQTISTETPIDKLPVFVRKENAALIDAFRVIE